jgi:hypothetical protein
VLNKKASANLIFGSLRVFLFCFGFTRYLLHLASFGTPFRIGMVGEKKPAG